MIDIIVLGPFIRELISFGNTHDLPEQTASDAFFEIAKLVDSVPVMRPIVEVVAKAQPKSCWTLFDLANYMQDGGDDEDVQRALVLLKTAQVNLANLAAERRDAARAWLDYLSARALISRAEFGRKDGLRDAREMLYNLITRVPEKPER